MTLPIIEISLLGITIILLLILVLRKGSAELLKSELVRLEERVQGLSLILSKTEQAVREEARFNREELAQSLKNLADSSSKQILELTRLNEQKLENLRETISTHLQLIQRSNEEKLEQMRATVDEKLQSTLERRLGESFSQVREQLESVNKGLGEMQKLASEVGNLQKVLSNIKTRGTLGEIQLEKILEQILSPEQYGKNVKINGKVVEFAIKLPGKGEGTVFLPIDSKFPMRSYEELLEAQERGDREAVEQLSKALEAAIKLQARDINDKYILPPKTTDFAIMFLPIEGLYAEVLRRPGLFEALQIQYKVAIAGPTTFAAFLNSLQMGFKTLAIEKQASKVRTLLLAVKTDIDKFMDNLAKAKEHLEQASHRIEDATKRSQIIGRKLKEVEALPASETEKILESGGENEELPES